MEILAKSFVDETGNLFFDVSVEENGTLIEKRVPIKDFLSLFDNTLRDKEIFIPVPRLRDNVYAAWTSSESNDTFRGLFVYKQDKRPFSIAGGMYVLPFPTLLMDLTIVKGVKRELKIFALDTDNPTDDSLLYHYPFGNVYESGSVCMGNIVIEKMNLENADEVFYSFINGITNEHLYRCQNTMKLTQGELVTYIKSMDEYPKLLLMPIDKTIGNLKLEGGSCLY